MNSKRLKMKLLLVTLVAIYLCSMQANCLNLKHDHSKTALKLQNLCSKSTFQYKGIEVNSFLQRKFNFTLQPVGTFAILETSLNLEHSFKNKTNLKEFQKILNNYNEYLVGLYSEEFMNSEKIKNIEQEKKKILEFKNSLLNVTESECKNRMQGCLRTEIYYMSQAFHRLLKMIDQIQQFTSTTLNSCVWELHSFKYYIDCLQINPETERFAFENDFLEKIYKKELKKYERFYFIKGSNKYYDMVHSYGILEISVDLPFNNKQYKEEPCVDGATLSAFFAKKTES